MGPGNAGIHELFEEQGGGDRSTGARSGVLHIGQQRFEAFAIGAVHRHAPESFSGIACSGFQITRERIIRGPESGDLITEGDHASTGERCQINDGVGLELGGIHQGIGEGEASLRIGVVDLDCGAVGCRDDVAGVNRGAVDHVFAGGHHHVHLHSCRAQLSNAAHRSEDRRASAHVELHHVDLGGTDLEVVSAGIKGESLAHQNQSFLGDSAGPIGEVDEFRSHVRALADRQVRAHASLLAVGSFQHGELKTMLMGQSCRGAGQFLRGDAVGWCRHQFPGQLHAGADRMNCFQRLRQARWPLAQQLHLFRPWAGFGLAAKAQVAVERQAHSFSSGSGISDGVYGSPRQQQPKGASLPLCCAGGGRCGHAQAVAFDGSGLSQPQQHQGGAVTAQQLKAG